MQARPPRFEIEKPVQFRVQSAGGPREGHGRTLNISRRGVLFETAETIAVGEKIDLVVSMGDAVGSGSPIELRLQGEIVRTQDSAVAVAVRRYNLAAEEDGQPSQGD